MEFQHKMMQKIWHENRYFFIPFIILLLFWSVLLLGFPKPELHILINKNNSPFFDVFFSYLTFLGDGANIAVLFIVLLFKKIKYAFIFLTGSLVSSLLIVNLLKKIILHNIYRPAKYFELFETYKLHLVEGVKMHALQSFPSGHSATAFNLFFMLALLVKNNILKFLFFCVAALVAFSRVYLSQHFLVDIAAGAVLGVAFIAFAWMCFENKNAGWLNQSIINVLKKNE